MKYDKAMGLDFHTNVEGVFVTRIRANGGRAFVLDDVATMEIGNCQIVMDKISSKLVYGGGGGGGREGERYCFARR